MDRISHLPEDIQHRILGCLEQEEVGRAAVVSKAWRSIIESYPALLSFTQAHFDQTYAKMFGFGDPFLLRGHQHFSNLIDETVRKKSVVEKLSLSLTSCHHRHAHWQSQLDSWIQHLGKLGGLKELTLCLVHGFEPDSPLYILPPSGLCSKTLTKLSLSSSFNVDLKHCNRVNLPNLLELKLDISDRNKDMFQVFISGCPNLLGLALSISDLNQELFKNFLSGCPNLLWLNLTISNLNQHMFKNFVFHCPNLLHLDLETSHFNEATCKNVMSGCPNLETLTINLTEPEGVSSICVSGLTRLHCVCLYAGRPARVKIVAPKLRIFKFSTSNGTSTEIDLSACESTLKVLSLTGLRLTKETLSSVVSKFPELETLVMQCLNVDGIEIPNKKIRKLKVTNCFELEKFEVGALDLEFLSFLGLFGGNMSLGWINTFKEYYPNLTRFKDIKLTLQYGRNVVICDVLDESFIKMLYEMKEKQLSEFLRLEVLLIGSCEGVLERVFSNQGYNNKIDHISILSRDDQSHELYLQALKNMTFKDGDVKYVLDHVELTPTVIPNCFETVECNITHIRLHWIRPNMTKRYVARYTHRQRRRVF